jgi:kynureninase
MRILQSHELKQLSFPDAQVTDMQLLAIEKVLVILLDGAWLETAQNGESLKSCHLVIKNWETLRIQAYNHTQKCWFNLPIDTTDLLKDICEAEFSANSVHLRGFGTQSGQWLEYIVEGMSLILVCYVLPESVALAA